MATLCLDTSTASPIVAVLDDAGALLGGCVVDGRAQALLGAIDELVRPDQVEAIVVGIGPGGFTGLRVGVATARGLAEALGVPLYGVSSTFATAAEVALADPRRVDPTWAVLAAGRGECFVEAYRANTSGDVHALGSLEVVELAAVEAAGESRGPVVRSPTPKSLGIAAWQVLQDVGTNETTGAPLAVVPTYVRAPDATPPRMEVRLGKLGERDLDAVLVIEARSFATPWTRAMYLEELGRPSRDAVLLAARDTGANERLVGAALAHRIGDCWHVMNVLVDPSARGRGIGAQLVRELLARTQALGMGKGWTLEVRDGNAAAIALYEGLGFTHAGRRPGYYEDTGDDALVMWRRDPYDQPAGVSP